MMGKRRNLQGLLSHPDKAEVFTEAYTAILDWLLPDHMLYTRWPDFHPQVTLNPGAGL